MGNKEHYLKSFLISGLIMGLLSAAPVSTCCCCLWMILGGGLAGWMLCRSAKNPVRPGEGALIGLFSGLFGGMIFSLGQALHSFAYPDQFRAQFEEQFHSRGYNMPPELEQFMNQMISFLAHPGLMLGTLLFFSLIIFGIIAMLGAMIAVSIFEPRFAAQRVAVQGQYFKPVTASGPFDEIKPTMPAPEEWKPESQEKVSGFGARPAEPDLYFPKKPKEE